MSLSQPVLWSLSKRSGSLFQQPLFAALNQVGQAYAVCHPNSPALQTFAQRGKLLASPPLVNRVADIPAFLARFPAAHRQMAAAIRKHATVVHVTMPSPIDALFLSSARKAGVPIILTIHDNSRHLGEESWLFDAIDKRIIAQADHLVTLSKFVFDDLKARNLAKPLHFVPNSLLTRDVAGLPPRQALHEIPRLLFLGRIHAYKGLALLLESLDLLAARGLNFALTIAGSGDLSPYATALAKRSHVTVINDWIDDAQVMELLRDNDILALPYLEASQSGVAIDAQWAAMPAVATPVGALPQQFNDGIDALLCRAVTAEAFAESLTAIAQDKKLYASLSSGAAKAYKEKDLVPVANRWREFYSTVIDRR
jgi:glycosyltransferase involved in cell wall biosynthesis